MPAHDSTADPAADDWELHFVVLGKAAGNRRRWSSLSVVWKLETFYSGLFGIAIQRLWTSSGMSFGHLASLVFPVVAVLTSHKNICNCLEQHRHLTRSQSYQSLI